MQYRHANIHAMPLWKAISQDITRATGLPFEARRQRSLGGGCINSAYLVEDGEQRYFVKTNAADKAAMFAAEAAGLRAILASQTVRAPRVICQGVAAGYAYLVLEYIDIENGQKAGGARLGEQLAAMHQCRASSYGWDIDNTIGATPQINTWHESWPHFYRENRLRYQLDLAARQGFAVHPQADKLLEHVPDFFVSYQPPAALLHGDLWGGNWGADTAGNPLIFDPALYYGDRETDLAMTELFGGFPSAFYTAYAAAYPLEAGYATRKYLYNLYHVLNHLNLFGASYLHQARSFVDRLLTELGR